MIPQEINKKIAEWLLGGSVEKLVNIRDYNTNAAFDLLDVLVELGHEVTLEDYCDKWRFSIATTNGEIRRISETKSGAICDAIIRLIELENDNDHSTI